MHQDLTSELNALADQLQLYFQFARNLTDDQFHEQPTSQEWSLCQVMEHLFMSETGTLGYMVKKSSSGWDSLEVEGEEQIQNGRSLSMRLQSGEKYKAPSVLPEPPNTTTRQTFEHEWPKLREQLQNFVQGTPESHFNKLVFKQPYAGMISLPQAISFLKNHMTHHLAQAETIIQHVQK
jgi:uncharacterized damage-inducible protein DinB